MPEDIIEEIKSRIDLKSFISDYVLLRPVGANFRGLCPFHKEKTPSFFVSPEKGLWRCFGCLAAGDIFTFVEKIEGVEFPEALRILAQKAGVELRRFDRHLISQKTKLLDLCDLSAKFYHKILKKSSLAGKAKDYLLKERGLKEETLNEFNLGFAPSGFDTLKNFLFKKGHKEEEMVLSGLIIRREENKIYDRFRNRIIFPITNLYGQTIGFTARIMPGTETEEGKYINTPETLIFNKRKILYGLDKAKKEIREKKEAVLVEGQMDVIACYQAGFKNVVCSSGTALTEEQVNLLSRYTQAVILGFDLDLAGEEATKRGIDLLLKEDFKVKILQLEESKDPDECLRRDKNAFEKALRNALPIMEYYFFLALRGRRGKELSIEEKKEITKKLLPLIAKLGNAVEQNLWLKKLASELEIEERFLYEDFRKNKKEPEVLETAKSSKPQERLEKIGENFLGLLIKNSDFLKEFKEEILPEMFFLPLQREVVLTLKKGYNQNLETSEEIKRYLDELDFIAEIEFGNYKKEEKEKEIRSLFVFLKKAYLTKQIEELEKQIKEAEKFKDEEKIKILTERANIFSKELSKGPFNELPKATRAPRGVAEDEEKKI